jgi:hypothetical protein
MLVAIAIPSIRPSQASAYGLLSNRSIRMSNSSSGTLTAGQNVAYEINFTTVTTAAVGSVTIDFCVNNPIIGDTCTAPTGFDTNFGTLAIDAQTGGGGDPFSIDTGGGSTSNKILLTRTANSIAASTLVSVQLGNGTSNGFTNQTPIGTFYARIMTWTNTNGTGTNTDAGGVALATTVSVDITSKVQERLKFCVYRDITCAAAGATPNNAFNLGNNNGVLDSVGPFVDKNTKYDVATNASGGVSVRMKGDTLKTGTFSITPIGAASAVSIPASEQFGFCTYPIAGSTSPIVPVAPYNSAGTPANCAATSQTSGTASSGGAGTAEFAFDVNTTDGTMSTFGDIFATKPAGAEASGALVFIGNVADTTEAGIYTTSLNLIATGVY